MAEPAAADLVVHTADSGALCVTLNRPRKLNALTLDMIEVVMSAFAAAERDGAPLLLLVGAGGRAFCAGGDVKALGTVTVSAKSFLSTEYSMNAALAQMRTPTVALWDGIVMGGGCGVSIHGAFRVATERTLWAMPECAIGLVPDIGASFFLNQLPGDADGAIGLYLALTGARLHAADVMSLQLATHWVPSSVVPALKEALLSRRERLSEDEMAALIASLTPADCCVDDSAAHLSVAVDSVVRRTFGSDRNSVAEIVEAVGAECGSDDSETAAWAKQTLAALQSASPTALVQTFFAWRHVREQLAADSGSKWSLWKSLQLEYRVNVRAMPPLGGELAEGVRARLLDKDNSPKWQAATVDDVDEAAAKESLFTALDAVREGGELLTAVKRAAL